MFNLCLYLIPASTIILIAFLMFSTDKRKFSGDSCNCCNKPMTVTETFANKVCPHCLLALKRLNERAPLGYHAARGREVKPGQKVYAKWISVSLLTVREIKDGKIYLTNSLDTHVLHTIGCNTQEFIWIKNDTNEQSEL